VPAPTPAIPSFTDGTVVHQADLNALASNLTNLYNYNQGGFFTRRPCVLVQQTSGQAILNTTHTLVNYQSALVNTDNMWTASVANQLTIQHAGLYWIFAQTRWPAQGGATLNNFWLSHILVNGTAIPTNVGTTSIASMLNQSGGQQIWFCANLAVNATLYLDVYHNAGVTETLAVDVGGSTFGAFFVTGP
jgi:hypothetical protein